MSKIPKWLGLTFHSVAVDNLDFEEDKVFIINQVLANGGLRELKWLFEAYPKKTIKDVFISQPMKIYTNVGFNFTREILLELDSMALNPDNYVLYVIKCRGGDWWQIQEFLKKEVLRYTKKNLCLT